MADRKDEDVLEGRKLFIGNITYHTRERELEDLFSKFGPLKDVRVAIDSSTGRSRGYAFVTMSTASAALAAVKAVGGREIDGRALRVEISHGERVSGGRERERFDSGRDRDDRDRGGRDFGRDRDDRDRGGRDFGRDRDDRDRVGRDFGRDRDDRGGRDRDYGRDRDDRDRVGRERDYGRDRKEYSSRDQDRSRDRDLDRRLRDDGPPKDRDGGRRDRSRDR